MESLITPGKLRIVEDALTAALSDLLADLGDPVLVRTLLGRARLVRAEPNAVAPPAWDSFSCELWPDWHPHGEPDLVLWLKLDGEDAEGGATGQEGG